MPIRVGRLVLAFAVAALLGAIPPSLELMHQHGSAAYGERRYAESRHWLFLPAHLGNNGAQALLGAMYALGQGTSQDGPAALYWLELAALGEVTEAQTMLGALYATGTVAPQNPEKAILWLSKAAGKGDREASALLRLYRTRSGSI